MAPLPSILTHLSTLLRRSASPLPESISNEPISNTLAARSDSTANAAAGVTPPANVPNQFIFVLIGLIGAGFVITGIWFFFWAKNGGCYFHENDWDDYKSTVLRRKGPNGTTLSGATESTNLGGGSVVHGEGKSSRWGKGRKNKRVGKGEKGYMKGEKMRYKDYDEEESTVGTQSEVSSLGGKGVLKFKAKKNKKNKKSALREVDSTTVTESVLGGGDDYQSEVDVGVRDALRTYRHEKPARVGGLNKESDASAWDGSTNDNSTAASDLLSHREKTPTNTPTKVRKERNDTYTGGTGGIRKVVSTSGGGATSDSASFWNRSPTSNKKVTAPPSTIFTATTDDSEHIKAEAKRLQEKGRAAQRRDFSFQAGDDNSTVVSSLISVGDRAGRGSGDREREERRAARREERRASRSPTKKLPGSYVYEESEMGGGSEVSGDTGTKSYPCYIPGLSSESAVSASVVGTDYAEERRKKRSEGRGGGYRRE